MESFFSPSVGQFDHPALLVDHCNAKLVYTHLQSWASCDPAVCQSQTCRHHKKLFSWIFCCLQDQFFGDVCMDQKVGPMIPWGRVLLFCRYSMGHDSLTENAGRLWVGRLQCGPYLLLTDTISKVARHLPKFWIARIVLGAKSSIDLKICCPSCKVLLPFQNNSFPL